MLKFFTFLFLSISLTQSQTKIVQYVNPFIGTANGGNTFPGAVVPWGMISISPHNSPGSPSGYVYGEKKFYGFGHNHLSGTGCADLGSIIITVAKNNSAFTPESYKSHYSREAAEPGYYSLYLDEFKLKAEVTAATRSGFTKFSSDNEVSSHILFDVGRSLNLVGGGSINIVSNYEIEGGNVSGGFCGENNRQTLYFVAQFSQSFSSAKLWAGDYLISQNNFSGLDTPIVCILDFNISPDNPLLIRVGISYTSIKNARENLENEIPGWDFEGNRKESLHLWEKKLSRILIETENNEDKIKFYSALYHMLIHPNIINDVNGDYPLMGSSEIGNYYNRKRYTIFSLWDTYRTLHPFLTLVYPEIQLEMINTMLDMFDENGYLPKWELTANETYMMVGDPAVPVIVDSYIKGLQNFDVEKALESILKPVLLNEDQPAPPVRAGYHEFLKYKYIPFEQDYSEDWWVWGPVSTTLEYCLSDWAISQFLKKIGRENYYEKFWSRSGYYKNLFDKTTLFMRPKLRNGNWLTPFDSLAIEGSGNWSGSGGPGYVEGNAWNYTWFVPHDIEGLINLFGNENIFAEKLLRAFNENHFTINNEPDIGYPYLFTYISGKEKITPKLVTTIMENDFGIGPNGLPGNDDCGTISGWFVFSALGFYPVCPASNEYRFGIPLFDKISISLNKDYYPGNHIIIEKQSNHFNKIFFNETEINNYKINHSDLVKGGKLIFKN